MKHQAKQALAWVIAIGASSALYGGGTWWLKRLAAQSPGHGASTHDEPPTHGGEEHGGDDQHGAPEKHAAAGHNDGNGAKPDGHGAPEKHAIAGHGDEHGAKPDGHGADGHGAPEKHATAGHGDGHGAKKEEHAEAAKPAAAHGAPHWSYKKDAPDGPKSWGSIADSFAQCEKGREQSPIDIRGAVPSGKAPSITWHYNPAQVNIENNGHTIVAAMPDTQNHIMIDAERYDLAQFHFHNPSEHKIAGIPADMELHFVHKNAKGGLAVIGVMIHEKPGEANAFIKPLWDAMPKLFNSKATVNPTLQLTKLMPTHRDYYHYAGSLTTPPCSQGVRWFVLKDPIHMNGNQIDQYSGIFGGPTNRPVQPLFSREVIQSAAPADVAH